ncbi:DNA-formamidopyrimidine glycosylase family protein [Corynebacterium doosanense]|uniref:DNA-(apurinic or apyrimidinic site) lyase n=1 Tax=Corynebacterium doosanense CAU 212 = DSM 45436 TaxID=558173 RepID=A0A097IEG6_9CORY|nr:DNA-formamidopyrimidine glycosylase family protein [Corynebacterium doosanense]AIT60532.1 endonuclease [Corynebacterium doosanense CAU 212 = DSM 45436]
MPEGDSVLQLSNRLQFMTGREVLKTDLRVPRYATTRFDGAVCERVWPRGKHLFMQFGSLILHTHLKMEGTWAMHLKGDRWRKPGYTARVVLQLEGAPHPRPIEVVGHELGLVEVIRADEYAERMGYLGPDILDEDWDIDEAVRRIESQPETTIGQALLDQQLVAGLGNEYRAEICFLMGLHPRRAVASVDVRAVLELSRRLIWANRNSPIRVTTGVKRAGENSYVFGRYAKPCRRCRTPIEKEFLGGGADLERVIWWCPCCQG